MAQTFKRFFENLRSKDDAVREMAAKNLRAYVEEESRDMSSEAFKQYMNDIIGLVSDLAHGTTYEQLGAVRAIDLLIDIPYQENETRIRKFDNSLRNVLQSGETDQKLLSEAAKTLGHLVRVGGTMTADLVNYEVNRAFDWLDHEKSEQRRYAAVVVLAEVAANTPTLFNSHIPEFLRKIWNAIRDTRVYIRISAISAFRAALELIAHRENREIYSTIYNDLLAGFKLETAESIHGSLLVIAELLRNSEGFMLTRFKDVCDTVLSYCKSKDKVIRDTVAFLLPQLAAFCPDAFSRRYMDESFNYLTSLLKGNVADRAPAFYALGDLILVMGAIEPERSHQTIEAIKQSIEAAQVPASVVNAALVCLSMLARASGESLVPTNSIEEFTDIWSNVPLTPTLVNVLTDISSSVPKLSPFICDSLLQSISAILTAVPHRGRSILARDSSISMLKKSSVAPTSRTTSRSILNLYRAITASSNTVVESLDRKRNDSDSIGLALCTLGSFSFPGKDQYLQQFIQDTVIHFLDDIDPVIRRHAASTIIALLLPKDARVGTRRRMKSQLVLDEQAAQFIAQQSFAHFEQLEMLPLPETKRLGPTQISPATEKVVNETVERLLVLAISDVDTQVRQTIFASLDERYDPALSNPQSIQMLFFALNDESFDIRELVVSVIGRLSKSFPAAVMPLLRSILVRLLTQLQYGGDAITKEQSAQLIGALISSASKLVTPYVASILKVLAPKLYDSDVGVVSAVLAAFGHVATISGATLSPCMDTLLPIILDSLDSHDKLDIPSQASNNPILHRAKPRKETSLIVLGQLVQHCHCVIQPYTKYPSLLPTLLSLLKREVSSQSGDFSELDERVVHGTGWPLRREALKVLGIIGALDPFTHKMNQRQGLEQLQGPKADQTHRARKSPDHVGINFLADLPLDLPPLILPEEEEEIALSLPAAVAPIDKDAGQDPQPDTKAAPQPQQDAISLSKLPVFPSEAESVEDFYPTVALAALVKVLQDPTLAQYHETAVQAIMFTVVSLGPKCGRFLSLIVPTFLSGLRRPCEPELRKLLLKQLTVIVAVVKEQIAPFLSDLLELVNEFWNDTALLVDCLLPLLVRIAMATRIQFRIFLPKLVPNLLNIVVVDKSESRSVTARVLSVLETLGDHLSEYLHLVIPAFLRLLDHIDSPLALKVQTLSVMDRLSRVLVFKEYASRIIHGMLRVLESTVDATGQPSSVPNSPAASLSGTQRALAMDILCVMACQLEGEFVVFVAQISKFLAQWKIKHEQYEFCVAKLLKRQSLKLADLQAAPVLLDESKHEVKGSMDFSLESSNVAAQKKLMGSQSHLKKAWDTTHRSTRDDWIEWMRGFNIELLHNSLSPALRSCSSLAKLYRPIARELFNAAFISCWTELEDQYQDDLVKNLEAAFTSPQVPVEIIQILLNLCEFMEHDGKPLPIGTRVLAQLAEKCHAFAKALHYKETEFQISPNTGIEALISINNQLQLPNAAIGILQYAKQHHDLPIEESWYEKLQRWEDALEAYEFKQLQTPNNVELSIGRLRCLRALGEWDRLANLAAELCSVHQPPVIEQVAPLAAYAAWNLGEWDNMRHYVGNMSTASPMTNFYKSIIAVHDGFFNEASQLIEQTRSLYDNEITALVSEGYDRAYSAIVKLQQLVELEEIISYKRTADSKERAEIRQMWADRLSGCQRNVDVWQEVLIVRSLVLSPDDDQRTWLKFSSLCRKSGRMGLSLKVLTSLLGLDPNSYFFTKKGALQHAQYKNPLEASPVVCYAYLKHLWAAGFKNEAFKHLGSLISLIDDEKQSQALSEAEYMTLKAKSYRKLGEWKLALEEELTADVIPTVVSAFKNATIYDPENYKVWHAWAVMNFNVISFYKRQLEPAFTEADLDDAVPGVNVRFKQPRLSISTVDKDAIEKKINEFLVPAIKGFCGSLTLTGGRVWGLQDILRLLTLWFDYGSQPNVEAALIDGFRTIPDDFWLDVIPQIIARIDTSNARVRRLIHEMLCRIGKAHPQSLVYALTVASKSQVEARRTAALAVMSSIREHSDKLVEQAQMVSEELIRVAIIWHEMWHEALEEASRKWFGERNVEEMWAVLEPAHQVMLEGPQTLREIGFHQMYGRTLEAAQEWVQRYFVTRNESDLSQAWDIYSAVYRKISRTLPQISQIQLKYTSHLLHSARNLDLAVPGTYRAGAPIVSIASFVPTLKVIDSKQRPRKLAIRGSDGLRYDFLLKGHEDLRQDERVMQLFALVNTLLAHDRETSKHDLSIRGYSVIPLAPNSGLLQWLSNCDTMHALIKEYRDMQKILLNIEHRLMLKMAPDFLQMLGIQKSEVFQEALNKTTGQDLRKVMWLKSKDSEVWLDKRTNYTRSLAVMSMVGYILGLGDRHPCNLMFDRFSGKIIHVDFGDCFEVAMQREKFPERIPFRLTRLLVNAMEVSGIEGNFRSTCESVMRVLRDNKESVMAVLEAFVYDPLINWRLLQTDKGLHGSVQEDGKVGDIAVGDEDEDFDGILGAQNRRTAKQTLKLDPEQKHSQSVATAAAEDESQDVLNAKAIEVLSRVESKLKGKDFGPEVLDVPTQVQQLIEQATSAENLAQCYIGWCAFW